MLFAFSYFGSFFLSYLTESKVLRKLLGLSDRALFLIELSKKAIYNKVNNIFLRQPKIFILKDISDALPELYRVIKLKLVSTIVFTKLHNSKAESGVVHFFFCNNI